MPDQAPCYSPGQDAREFGLQLLGAQTSFVQIHVEIGHRLARLVHDPQIEKIIGQMRPRQKLSRQIGYNPCVLLCIGSQGSDALVENAVPDGQSQRGVPITERSGPRYASHAAKQIILKCPLDVFNS